MNRNLLIASTNVVGIERQNDATTTGRRYKTVQQKSREGATSR